MPLPNNPEKLQWPPEDFAKQALPVYDEVQAWWTGTPEVLDAYYRGHSLGQHVGPAVHSWQYNGGVAGWIGRRFWGDPPSRGTQSTRLHLPLGADIIQTSATLLFGEPVAFAFPGKKIKAADGTVSTKDTETKGRTTRLDKIMNSDEAAVNHLVAGEFQAAFGGVYGRIVCDPSIRDHAWIDYVDADRAIPEFIWGVLRAVTFWTELIDEDRTDSVWRHLERHEPGVVYHGLYKGDENRLGMAMPLEANSHTRSLAARVNDQGAIPTGLDDELAVEYVPNMRPNPLWRQAPRLRDLGRPDLTQDVIGMLHGLDETYTSLIRDVRLGRARLVVSGMTLKNRGPGRGQEFDLDDEVYEQIQGDPNNPLFNATQFAIRVDEHLRIGDDLTHKAIRKAGYSPFSFGFGDDGVAMTATEVEAKASASFQTRKVKSRLWSTFFQRMVPRLLRIDAANFASESEPSGDEIEVTWPAPVRDTDLVKAQTVAQWESAKAVSLETKVQYLHSDWDQDRIDEEIERIREEVAAAAPPDPFKVGEENPIGGEDKPEGSEGTDSPVPGRPGATETPGE